MKHTSNYYPTSRVDRYNKKRAKAQMVTVLLIVAIIFTGTILGIILGKIIIRADTLAEKQEPQVQSCTTSTESDTSAAEPDTTVAKPDDYMAANSDETYCFIEDEPAADAMILQVPTLSQYPELPTGCEATAATMALNYIGCPTYLEAFASLLPCQNLEFRGNEIYGADPNEFFIGNPAKEINCFGCFENVIIQTINQNYGNCRAEKAYGSLEDLCAYIQEDVPVLVWATMEMQDVLYQASWTLPDGTIFTWPSREHCLLLVGYDNEMFYFNDPLSGTCVGYEKYLSELRYEEMGCRAVIIWPY
ncbi:MAG: C39 family peptidase [Lachnospiraceae bacterium]|nr:C39 family peptidase [Lachnospiraceae bacterium]